MMKTQTIEHSMTIKASPLEVYNAFMDEGQHRAFTGYTAKIENTEGGKFETCGHRNFGYSVYLKPAERIIQAWRQIGFPDHQYSIIDIKLELGGDGRTKLNFVQLGAPEECVDWLVPGWQETYWEPLKKYLETGLAQSLRE